MPYTRAELVREARRRGFEAVSERLVTDWASLGLLDHPARAARGTGGGRGARYVFSEAQRELFLALLTWRGRHRGVRRLADVVVTTWLYRGNEYIGVEQVRRVLRTWIGTGLVPSSQKADNEWLTFRAVHELIRGAPQAPSQRQLRRIVSDSVTEARHVDEDQLFARLVEVMGLDEGWSPSDHLLFLCEGMAGVDVAKDEALLEARAALRRRRSSASLVMSRQGLSRWLATRQIEPLIDRSCETFLLELGEVELDRRGKEALEPQRGKERSRSR